MIKVTLRKIRLNRGGYDSSGAYWGLGVPLYRYSYIHPLNNTEYSCYIRASSRALAKEKIRQSNKHFSFTFSN